MSLSRLNDTWRLLVKMSKLFAGNFDGNWAGRLRYYLKHDEAYVRAIIEVPVKALISWTRIILTW